MVGRIDLTGQTFGRLTVLAYAGSTKGNNRHALWECRCECGEIKEVKGVDLRAGRTTSCGCYVREIHTRHGMSDRASGASALERSTYKSWCSMIGRCTDAKNKAYSNYGGRGIQVCEQWLDFSSFLKDMGVKTFNDTIERLDVNKGYSPDNCIWLDKKLQARNKQNTIWVEVEGREVCLAEACEIYDIPSGAVRGRIRRGWDIQRALQTKTDGRYKGEVLL